jgi:hypothetical protein
MMAVPKHDERPKFDAHRLEMIRLMEEIDARAGVVDDPTMTIEKLREMQRRLGIRPQDNILSREIIRMRYRDEDGEP